MDGCSTDGCGYSSKEHVEVNMEVTVGHVVSAMIVGLLLGYFGSMLATYFGGEIKK